jgi:hypothetical protein
MSRKLLIAILAILILGGALAGGLFWHWYQSPRYALQQMALALKTRDMDNFFKYIDLKEILNNSLEDLSRDLGSKDKPDQGADEWTRLTRQFGRKFARQLLPKLFDTFEPQIKWVIESYLRNLTNTQILAVAAAVTVARIEVKGDVAQVTLRHPKGGDSLHFQMQRQPQGVWRIVSVNYQDLKKFIQRDF